MRAVYLIGIGQTAVSKNGGVRGRYLVADAIEQAIYHAGIDPADIGMLVVGNMMSGILAQQRQLGALCADVAGLRGTEAATVEAAWGTAGANQVKDPSIALVQNIGGTGATVVSHILKRAA